MNDLTKNEPLVSVCMPAYNCERYIGETLRALCSQSYSNIEIIVVNDGSADGTQAVAADIGDNRIRLINVPNGGAARARNIAYRQSKGEFIVFFDADDLVGPDFIFNQMQLAMQWPECMIVSAWGRFYADMKTDFMLCNEPLTTPHTLEQWVIINWYHSRHNTPPGRLMLPRVIVDKAGPWNEELTLNDDFEFFTRVALQAKMIVPCMSAVYGYRTGVNGLSSQKNDPAYLSLFRSMLLSFEPVLAKYGANEKVQRSCANLWKAYIYEVYPRLTEQRNFAKTQIKVLGGTDFNYPAGGLTSILIKFAGWRIVKQLKILVKK
ncbi:glycosyltransferase family 2 protein [Mucilaginibacter corticis]|uniref:Glycosyltransferase family 2 protein n=1 Tax=Mucilaginibacter corticis TaxID=2597670 RepID=A0A556M7T0_9SPHI|nr:glycosyltransferase family 2 protein [Mucilaginibacter corticis]TSJ35972.1 glycosyltransferase family 2 protein [Mucilaginibacter corticis]